MQHGYACTYAEQRRGNRGAQEAMTVHLNRTVFMCRRCEVTLLNVKVFYIDSFLLDSCRLTFQCPWLSLEEKRSVLRVVKFLSMIVPCVIVTCHVCSVAHS
jgi:hypothetical protein